MGGNNQQLEKGLRMAEFKVYPADQDFEKFWSMYPKKRAKGDARKAWFQTASIRPSVERIVNAVMAMAATEDWQKSEGQYIPLPASFLRGERWEDVPEVEIVNGKVWWQTVSGIDKKAAELGLKWDGTRESYQDFGKRLKSIVEGENVVQMRGAG